MKQNLLLRQAARWKKAELERSPFRLLRRDVAGYLRFTKRICHTVDFRLSAEEIALYQRVNDFLKREVLYSVPAANRTLVRLVIRKLMASSSFAVAETFDVLRKRVERLLAGTRSAKAMEGFDVFWSFVEDEAGADAVDSAADEEDTAAWRRCMEAEQEEIRAILQAAAGIRANAKMEALLRAVEEAAAAKLEAFQSAFHARCSAFRADGERDIAAFDAQFAIAPVLRVEIILEF